MLALSQSYLLLQAQVPHSLPVCKKMQAELKSEMRWWFILEFQRQRGACQGAAPNAGAIG